MEGGMELFRNDKKEVEPNNIRGKDGGIALLQVENILLGSSELFSHSKLCSVI
jgi:hypothetical protein